MGKRTINHGYWLVPNFQNPTKAKISINLVRNFRSKCQAILAIWSFRNKCNRCRWLIYHRFSTNQAWSSDLHGRNLGHLNPNPWPRVASKPMQRFIPEISPKKKSGISQKIQVPGCVWKWGEYPKIWDLHWENDVEAEDMKGASLKKRNLNPEKTMETSKRSRLTCQTTR